MTNYGSTPRFRWLGAAFVVIISMGLAHTAAQLGPQPKPANDDQAALFRLMDSCQMNLAGTMRTMRQVEEGFGWFFGIASVAMGIAGFAVLTATPRPGPALRRLSAVYAAALVLMLADSLLYWFIIPTAFISLSLLLVIVSLARDGRTVAPVRV